MKMVTKLLCLSAICALVTMSCDSGSNDTTTDSLSEQVTTSGDQMATNNSQSVTDNDLDLDELDLDEESEEMILDAQGLMDKASRVTVEAPGHPDVVYVKVNGKQLQMAAHPIDSEEITELELPLKSASYQLSSKINLADTAKYPTIFRLVLNKPDSFPIVLEEKILNPGDTDVIDTKINVIVDSTLLFQCIMVDEAKNNWAARFYLNEIQLRKLPVE